MKTIYEFLLNEHLLNEHLLKSKTNTSTQNMGYVDLGLPSGLLWARCNIGASEPYEYGDYFMWGSTEPDTDKRCDWTNCPFNNSSNDYDRNYFNSIKDEIYKNGILVSKYDPATVILGDDWRLPTNDDFEELIDNTEHKWIKNYQGSKINGVLLTAKNAEAVEANDDALFIPSAGYRSDYRFRDRGRHAYLWSSSLRSSSLDTSSRSCAMAIYLDYSYCYMCSGGRYNGYCLRGVKNK